MEYGGKHLGMPEALLRPAPLTPTKGSASQRLETLWIVQTASSKGWPLSSWGREPHREPDCRKKQSAIQGMSTFSSTQPDTQDWQDPARWWQTNTGRHQAPSNTGDLLQGKGIPLCLQLFLSRHYQDAGYFSCCQIPFPLTSNPVHVLLPSAPCT